MLTLVLAVTAANFVAQVVGAALSGSLALVADAGHMLTDVMGLVLALVAAGLMTRAASTRRTWGFVRAEVLSAAAQALVLGGVAVYVLVEGIRRLLEPPPVASGTMLAFGLVGLIGNGVAIALLTRSRTANLNLRAAFLEVVNDALGSVAVIVAAVVITTTGWLRADAVVSLLVGLLILPRALLLLREAAAVLLESTPRGLDLAEVRSHLLQTPHVHDVHDLHASQIATGLPVLSAHVVVDDSCFHDGHLPSMLDAVQRCVADHFPVSIEHSTFQFEPLSHVEHEHATHA
ncbi:MAG: Cobalt-zinc-cadmium resistance protein CzcD [uncultured Friedmanniella sp.]|uniref:Cobalt-zinc-cadmium resistance protein CzcD n=1 Tax=uncultured Friedmanniella sp. TaxID=335381 RepID=A0A6J4KQG5_9ACTN|nr:MAG: Cobalt-zinc-cadmium resistance protein CzcD [uncultured Friedmanniella sp.]